MSIAPASPTLLMGRVYPSLRHALVSLLLWSLGGMTGALVYHVSDKDGFPNIVLENAELLGGPARDRPFHRKKKNGPGLWGAVGETFGAASAEPRARAKPGPAPGSCA
jgi:hypothetical protein